MSERYSPFHEYTAIRRRVERHLNSGMILVFHIVLFVLASYFMYASRQSVLQMRNFASFMTVWSFVLLAQSVWAYRRSGAFAKSRERVINAELAERIKRDDTALLDNPRFHFRIQTLLDDDIQQRAGVAAVLLTYAGVNAATWVFWALQGVVSWTLVPTIAVFMLVPAYALNRWRRQRRDARLRALLGEMPRPDTTRDRFWDDADDRAMRLTADGELIDLDEIGMKDKAKRG